MNRKLRLLSQCFLPAAALLAGCAGLPGKGAARADRSFLPPSSLDLVLEAPVDRWDEALPLGNGLLGGLLWGRENRLRLSLDRGDLWDLRLPEMVRRKDWTWKTIQELVARKDHKKLVEMFDRPYNAVPHPTKLPAGRLEFDLDPSWKVRSFELSLARAEGFARFEKGEPLRVFYSAASPVALLLFPKGALRSWRILAPRAVRRLGYPAAEEGGKGTLKWYRQKAAKGLVFAAVAGTRKTPRGVLMAVTVTAGRDGEDPLGKGRALVASALEKGYQASLLPHLAFWRDFWSRSRIWIPDERILKHYYLVQYFYGAASRPGAPPMPLQGVWTADSGGLPPWKGDYHNDLNTQTTYMAYLTSGRFEEGRCFLDFLWKLLPRFRRFARRFYGAPGAAVPGVMTLGGDPMGGWSMYSLSPTNAGWIGHLFYEHWRYTMDRKFLEEMAFPWCREIALCLKSLLRPGPAGNLVLPLSSSPEIHNNSLAAWLTPNSNYDHDNMEILFRETARMARALGRRKEAEEWEKAARDLGPRAVDPARGELLLCPGEALKSSHRHFSHTMSIHPFGLVNVDGGKEDRKIIDGTIALYERLGTGGWVGYSFSWMSCLRARVGRAEDALRYLDIFVRAFILRNGFHANGDQLKAGFSYFRYRPFTLEGNFLAARAVHEMLLQSWGGVIRIFPAVPWKWHRVSFDRLRAEGGFSVSARREGNATVWFKITASRPGKVRIRDNFGGRTPRWSLPGVKKEGKDFVLFLGKGASLEGELPLPEKMEPPPPGAYLEFRLPGKKKGGKRK